MDTDDRDNQLGGEEDGRYDNVVRLPRDWLGPRSELVPIGSAADRADAEKARAAMGIGENGAADSITQDDFWGGDLESIPHPVVAPRGESAASESPTAGGAPARRARGWRARVAPARRAHGRRAGIRRRRVSRPSPPISHRALAAAAGLACAAAAAIALGVATGGSGVPQPLAAATPGGAGLALIPPFPNLAFRHVVSASASHSAVRKAPATDRRARARSSPGRAGTPEFVHAAQRTTRRARTTSSDATSSSTSTSRYAAPVSSEPISHPTTNETASKSSAQSGASKAGPIGPGAAITPGTLG